MNNLPDNVTQAEIDGWEYCSCGKKIPAGQGFCRLCGDADAKCDERRERFDE